VAPSPIKIHSVAEAYLLLMVTPCTACGKGPLEAGRHEAVDLNHGPGRKMRAACKACGQPHEFLFDLGYVDATDAADAAGLPRINASDEPSLAIDTAQWLMLFEGIVQAADRQSDPGEARRLGYEAAQCLEEALKFYPPGGGEWPNESAFFYDWTLARFREHRHIFARTRLADQRRKLPTLTQMEQHLLGQIALQPRKRPWWKFWG
jgi:hypothetical protein